MEKLKNITAATSLQTIKNQPYADMQPARLADFDPIVSKINELVDNTPYKKYVATIIQSTTDAPVPTIHENTIGDIVFTYSGTGECVGTLAGAFSEHKVFTIVSYGAPDKQVHVYRVSDDVINIDCSDLSGTPEDEFLIDLEIRVYN